MNAPIVVPGGNLRLRTLADDQLLEAQEALLDRAEQQQAADQWHNVYINGVLHRPTMTQHGIALRKVRRT